MEWRVSVANRKVVRRTGNPHDLVAANTGWFSDHDSHLLQGYCKNFISEKACIAFGHVRFIASNDKFPGIRLRFTPAQGLIYGPSANPDDKVIPAERAIYDNTKGWLGFGSKDVENQTLPPSLYAIDPPAPRG